MEGAYLCKFCNNLGIVIEDKQRSEKEKLLRNQYMVTCKWESIE
jgi:hypothetical protein